MKLLLPNCILLLFFISSLQAQVKPAPDRSEGEGPFNQLIIRGVTLIDGTGAPPFGPVDIVIEGNKITRIESIGFPGVQPDSSDRPALKQGGHEINADGMYVLPGFVDMHGHIGGKAQGVDAEYVYKLWMAHGITTIREPSAGNGLEWTLNEKRRSEKNQIVAPRIYAYTVFGAGAEDGIHTAEESR
ncbi:MAG: amidohydrolase, partial [Bacteroidota bacterium]|nr:amidohydrolase [Bacteroidota bacterium]